MGSIGIGIGIGISGVQLAGGGFPVWYGGTWALDGNGRAYNTPTTGGEILLNGNMESGSPPSNWTAFSGATLTSVADERTGGSGAAAINVARGTHNLGAWQAASMTDNAWYRLSGWIKNVDSAGGQLRTDIAKLESDIISATSWTQVTPTGRVTTDATIRLYANTSGSCRYDDVSLKQLTLTSLFASANFSDADATIASDLRAWTSRTQMGIVSRLDSYTNPQNYVIAYFDAADQLVLDKVVAGTPTQLQTNTVTFEIGARLEIRWFDSTTCQLWYNGAQVGSDRTVSDAGIVSNTRAGMLSTDSGNLFLSFRVDNKDYFPPAFLA